ncbi:MAG: fatty acid desaturase [Myxococcota bacterium]
MKGSSDGAGDDAQTTFARTRDGDLHRAIKAHGFKVDKAFNERSAVRVVMSAAQPFVYIATAVGLARVLPMVLGLALAFLLFFAAQRAFLTLVHDASHKLYSKKRSRNDALADFLAAGFIGMLLRKYRKIHLAHHAANGSADDPEYFGYEVVTKAGGWRRFILRYALGFEIPYLLGKYHVGQDKYLGEKRMRHGSVDDKRRFEQASILVCQGVLATAFFLAGVWWLYGMWLYVAVTWSPLMSRLRFLAEHPGHGELTMCTRGAAWELIYFAPYNFNYHLEHHLWPAIPPYRLKQVHAALRRSGFFRDNPQYMATTYVHTLSQYGTKWN